MGIDELKKINDLQKKTSRPEPLYFKGKGIFEKYGIDDNFIRLGQKSIRKLLGRMN